MSHSPTTPTLAELMHHVVSVALYRGGWQYVDGVAAGSPLAEWPEAEEAPPPLVAGDVVALRAPVAVDAGGTDVLVFRMAATEVEVDLVRAAGGYGQTWDTGTHAPAGSATVYSATALSALSPGDFGDLVVVDRWGLFLGQIETGGTFPALQYWGYLLSASVNPDNTGMLPGQALLPFLFGHGVFEAGGGPSGSPDFTFFAEGDSPLTGALFGYPATMGPNVAGGARSTVTLMQIDVQGDPVGGSLEYPHGHFHNVYASSSVGMGYTLGYTRTAQNDRFLSLGPPANLCFPLDASSSYRVLRYGGAAVP